MKRKGQHKLLNLSNRENRLREMDRASGTCGTVTKALTLCHQNPRRTRESTWKIAENFPNFGKRQEAEWTLNRVNMKEKNSYQIYHN